MELIATVIEVSPGRVRVRVAVAACPGCTQGCGGRCSLLASPREQEWELAAGEGDWAAGQRVRIGIGEAELSKAAWLGPGGALAGLVAGAVAGHAVGRVLGGSPDVATAIGLVLGTLAAVRMTKRASPEPRLLGPAEPAPPTHCQGGPNP